MNVLKITPPWYTSNGSGSAHDPDSHETVDYPSPVTPDWTPEDVFPTSYLPSQQLQNWVLAKIEYHQNYIRKLRGVYNSSSLIQRILPPELLMEIFAHIKPESRLDINILHVCRHWRSLALRTAEFWVDMVALPLSNCDPMGPPKARLNAEFFAGFLELASTRNVAPVMREFSPHMVEVMAPHCYRLSSLNVKVPTEHSERFFHMLSFGMPQLHTLTVYHHSTPTRFYPQIWSTLQVAQFPHDAFPRLQALHLPPVFLSPTLPVRSVRTLKIGGCKCRDCSDPTGVYTLHTILSFLRQCPRLSNLHIASKSREASRIHPTTSAAVELPCMQNLSIDLDRATWVSDILQHLIIPLTAVVRIEAEAQPNAYLPSALCTLPHVSAVDRVYFDFHIDEPNYVTKLRCKTAGHLRLSASVRDARRDAETRARCADATFAALASPHVTDVELFVSNSRLQALHGIDADRLARMLEGFPGAVRLCVWRAGVEELPEALRRGADGPDGVAMPWLCPSLRELVVRWRPPRRSSPTEVRQVFQALRSALLWRASRGCRLDRLAIEVRRLRKVRPPMEAEEVKADLERRFSGVAEEVQIVTDNEDWATTSR